MRIYRVLGHREVLNQRPGVEFAANLDPVQEERLVAGRFLEVLADKAGDQSPISEQPEPAGDQEE